MAEHLVHLLTAIEDMDKMMASKTGDLKFNAMQCERLGGKIVGMRDHLRLQADFSSITKDHCGLYFEKVCSVVRRANSYVDRFCKEQWVEEAIHLGQTSTWLSDILFDLDWWCEVVRCALLEAKGDTTSDLQVIRYEGFVELLGNVDVVCQSDLNDLVLKLKAVGNIEQKDGQLPAILLHKILKVAEKDADAAVLNFLKSSEFLVDLFTLSDQPIYKGTFGHVHRSSWFGLPCAKKVMNGSLEKEASFLTSLSHPNVHQSFYYGERPDRSSSCLVTELMYKDLSDFLKDRRLLNQAPLTMAEIVDIAHQVAKGMRYLHDMGVTHRDLKCANVLVSPRGGGDIHVKITDFGNAKGDVNTSTYGPQSTNVGTKFFKAPELFKINGSTVVEIGNKRFPFKADIYSFAMICVELLTGLPPHHTWATNTDTSQVKVFHKDVDIPSIVFRKIRPTLPDHCPQFLQSLIAACWDGEPKNRPTFIQTCEALQSFQVYLCKPVSKSHRWNWPTFYDIHQLINSYKQKEQMFIEWWFVRKTPDAGKAKTEERHTIDVIDISKDTGSSNPSVDKSPWKIGFDDWKKSIQFMLSEAFLHIHLGMTCGYLGCNIGLTIEHFTAALEIEPDNFYALRGRGQAELLWRSPIFARAMYDLKKANTAKARDVKTLILLGRTKRMMKPQDFKGALKYLNEAYELDPKYGVLFWDRGSVKKELKMEDQDVLEDYDKAIEFDPCSAEFYRTRGVFLREKGYYEDALKDLDRVLLLDPRHEDALRERAQLKGLNGDKLGAKKDSDYADEIANSRKRRTSIRKKLNPGA